MNPTDWRTACLAIAENHLAFVKFVMSACPENQQIQELGSSVTSSISELMAVAALEKAKQD